MNKPQRNALAVLAALTVIALLIMTPNLIAPKSTGAGSTQEQARHIVIPDILAVIGGKIATAGPRIVLVETVFRVAPEGIQTIVIPPCGDAPVRYRRGTFALSGDARGHLEYLDAGTEPDLHDQGVDFPPDPDANQVQGHPGTGDGTSIVATASGGVVTLTCKSRVTCVFSFH